jgi:hypothetical protein
MTREVEAWFEKLPQEWHEVAQRVRELILGAAPSMEEKWMFKSAPFYLHHGWLIYLALQKGRLIVGFCNGVHMADPEGLFARTQHAQIRHYQPPKELRRSDEHALRRLLDEAVKVNEAIAEQRAMRRRVKKRQR